MSIGILIGIFIGMEQDVGFIMKAKQTATFAGLAIVIDCISVVVAQ